MSPLVVRPTPALLTSPAWNQPVPAPHAAILILARRQTVERHALRLDRCGRGRDRFVARDINFYQFYRSARRQLLDVGHCLLALGFGARAQQHRAAVLRGQQLTESIADTGVGTRHEYRFRAHCCGISDLYKNWRVARFIRALAARPRRVKAIVRKHTSLESVQSARHLTQRERPQTYHLQVQNTPEVSGCAQKTRNCPLSGLRQLPIERPPATHSP